MHALAEPVTAVRRRTRAGAMLARILCVAILAAIVVGCGEDETRIMDQGAEPEPYPPATTQDQLIQNLELAFNERSFAEYEALLHEDFVFYFAPEDVDVLHEGVSWERARDLASMYNLFNGLPGQKPDGTPQAPVQRIELELIADDPGARWTDQVAEEFAGTTMKRYRAEMDVHYTAGSPSHVVGLQEFYAAPVEVSLGGSDGTVFRLKYWRDLGTTF